MEQNFFDENAPKKLPSGLNVLTILTFIGCAIALLGGIWQFISADKSVQQLEAAMSDPNMAQMPDFMKSMMSEEALAMAKKQAANKVPLLAINLIATVLCFVGALQMRKLKKQGYLLYVVGELLPLVGMALFLGMASFKGFGLAAVALTLLFVILYTVNRKHLTN